MKFCLLLRKEDKAKWYAQDHCTRQMIGKPKFSRANKRASSSAFPDQAVVSPIYTEFFFSGGAVASWLVRSTPDRAVLVRALAGDIALCSWTRHLTLPVPLSTT